MGEGVQVLGRRAVLDATDLSLCEAQPLSDQLLRNAVRAVGVLMERMQPVGAAEPAHVLSGEGVAELVGRPERGRDHWWRYEPIPNLALTGRTQRARVICSEACPTAAVSLLFCCAHSARPLSGDRP